MTNSSPSPVLEVNLSAIQDNYRFLGQKKYAAAVVKADAYGLGANEVASTLYYAGCNDFFVASLEEGIALRSYIKDASIHVFHGILKNQVQAFIAHNLIPVLNDPVQYASWNNAGKYALHVDTGMCRLGFQVEEIINQSQYYTTANLCLLMSHLACADEPEHPKNKEQLVLFRHARNHFKGIKTSLANSAGIFLSKDFQGDMLRPGCALYGISPARYLQDTMKNVVTLSAPLLQYRSIHKKETVGYGASAEVAAGSTLATVEIGYADGLLRQLAGQLYGYAAGIRVPVIGRVSMDMVSVDVSAVPEHLRGDQLRIEFINQLQTVDRIAEVAGTIGYEILTRLGNRVKRIYTGNRK